MDAIEETKTEKISDAVRALAICRKEAADAKAKLDEMRKEFEESEAYRATALSLVLANNNVRAADERLRSIALEAGDAPLHPAVKIRNVTRLVYDPKIAIAWCINRMPQALSLDTRLFEKHAKAVADTDPIRFVAVETDRQVAIATDLSKYLDQE